MPINGIFLIHNQYTVSGPDAEAEIRQLHQVQDQYHHHHHRHCHHDSNRHPLLSHHHCPPAASNKTYQLKSKSKDSSKRAAQVRCMCITGQTVVHKIAHYSPDSHCCSDITGERGGHLYRNSEKGNGVFFRINWISLHQNA